MKYEDDLHNCTPECIANMIEEIAEEAYKFAIMSKVDEEVMDAVIFENKILYEAARRLRELQKPTYHDER